MAPARRPAPRSRTAAAKNQPPPDPFVPVVVFMALAAVAAAVCGYPAGLVLFVGVHLACMVTTSPQLTGPKDKTTQQPAPASPAEFKAQGRYLNRKRFGRMWFRFKLVWPPRFSLAFGALFGLLATQLHGPATFTAAWAPHGWANVASIVASVVFTALTFSGWAVARRHRFDVPHPGVKLSTIAKAERRWGLAALVTFVAVTAGVWWLFHRGPLAPSAFDPPVGLFHGAVTAIGGGLLAGLFVAWIPAARIELDHWRRLRSYVDFWADKFTAVKIVPENQPQLLDFEDAAGGNATIFTFMGRDTVTQFAALSAALAGEGNPTCLSILRTPAIDGKGQEIPGEPHPYRFQLVTWERDMFPNVAEVTDVEIAKLAAQCAIFMSHHPGMTTPLLEGFDQIADGLWLLRYYGPIAMPSQFIRTTFGAEVWAADQAVPDGLGSWVYIGTSENVPFDEWSDQVTGRLDPEDHAQNLYLMRITEQYRTAWMSATGSDNYPTLYPGYTTREIIPFQGGSRKLRVDTFGVRSGVDPAKMIISTPKLVTALGAHFLTLIEHPTEQGTNFPNALTMVWANDLPPQSPSDIAASPGSEWLIKALVMKAFDDVKLRRVLPLLTGTLKCLTGGRARGGRPGAGGPPSPATRRQKHLWDSRWTIPGGLTVAAIASASTALKHALRVDYLRVAPVPGDASRVRLVFGCNPNSADLPPLVLRELTDLDWSQAWLDAKVAAPDGSTPRMLDGEAGFRDHESMPGVKIATFTIPAGLSMETIRPQQEKITTIMSAVYLKMVLDPKDPSRFSVLYAAGDWVDPLEDLRPVPFGPDVPLDLDKGPQVGWTEEGQPWHWPVLGVHTVAAAASGHGKGSWLWAIIRGLEPAIADGRVVLWGVDLKGGVEMISGSNAFARIAIDYPSAVELLTDACAMLDRRLDSMKNRGLRKLEPTAIDPLYLVLLDEMASFEYMAPSTKDRNAATSAISIILSRGRAANVCIDGFLQDPSKKALATRDLFTRRIAGRLDNPMMVDPLLGEGAREAGAAAHMIPRKMFGVAYVTTNNSTVPVRVRAPFSEDTDVAALNERLAGKVAKDATFEARNALAVTADTPLVLDVAGIRAEAFDPEELELGHQWVEIGVHWYAADIVDAALATNRPVHLVFPAEHEEMAMAFEVFGVECFVGPADTCDDHPHGLYRASEFVHAARPAAPAATTWKPGQELKLPGAVTATPAEDDDGLVFELDEPAGAPTDDLDADGWLLVD